MQREIIKWKVYQTVDAEKREGRDEKIGWKCCNAHDKHDIQGGREREKGAAKNIKITIKDYFT